ncbi:MAG TPA: heme-binding protein [Tepidisphaeraceae bacterium]|nr:heme-binding protein [Tepidisphaeraceae bacterium]
MRPVSIEALEQRQHLTVVNPLENAGSPGERLTTADVNRILAAAASQALSTQIIAVVDRENEILGVWAGADARLSTPPDQSGNSNNILVNPVVKAITKARTAAFFQSRGNAFSTRTARFIIQDNFPHPVPNTMGGPLYGVQFSTLPFSDFSFNSLGTVTGPAVSGDPGGIALFKNGEPVGGIGVAGDGRDFITRPDLPFDPRVSFQRDANGNLVRDASGRKIKLVFDGNEESDFDEAVAKAGAAAVAPGGGNYEADFSIQAERIFVLGLRFPYDADAAANGNALQTLPQLIAAGRGDLINPQQAVTVGGAGVTVTNPNDLTGATTVPLFRDARAVRGSPTPNYPTASFGGIDGELKNQTTTFDTNGDGVVNGNDRPADAFGFIPGGANLTQPIANAAFAGDDTNEDGIANASDPQLTVTEVKRIITNAVEQALTTRGAIREPLGVPARVHVAVVDRSGTTLGVFRMDDGTNFSYDVAVQKARTAAFFSDNDHAISPRAVGFVSQGFFPVNTTRNLGGPLFHLQNVLSLGILNVLNGGTPAGFAFPNNSAANPLANGITIFPGGAPLYKNGVLVGGIGISGDGVDQDDIIAFAGTKGFRLEGADLNKRVDFLSGTTLVSHFRERVSSMFLLYNLESDLYPDATESRLLRNLNRGLDGVRIPYVKFPRNPNV